MTLIWAHRGASAYAPENTLPAFELAAEQGAAGVELDVQLSADGELVVCHDETIDRTSNGTGKVKDLTLEQLRQFDFSAGHDGYAGTKIPTLREVFDLLGPLGLKVNVELKNSIEPYVGMPEQADALIAELGLAEQVLYSTFNHYSVRDIAASGSPVPVAVLHQDMIVDPWDYAKALGAVALHPHGYLPLLSPDYVPRSHEVGLKVNVWTIDDPGQMALLIRDQADGIITNTPDVAVALRG